MGRRDGEPDAVRAKKLAVRPSGGLLEWRVTGVSHDFALLLKARYPLILTDEERADELVRSASATLKLPVYTWTRSKGLRERAQLAASPDTLSPAAAFAEVERLMRPGLYLFHGLGADLEDPLVARRLRNASRSCRRPSGRSACCCRSRCRARRSTAR